MPDIPHMPALPLQDLAGARPVPAAATADAGIRSAAQELEAMFIAEMLKHAGMGKTPEGFGGGVGEEQFAGFLRQEQAREIAAQGGIGLAESIIRAMARREDVDDGR
mgnify:FL=1